MKNSKSIVNARLRQLKLAKCGLTTALPLTSMALLLTACGGSLTSSNSNSNGTSSGNAQNALLRVGMQRQYSGTMTLVGTPGPGSQGETASSGSYKFIDTERVLQAPANSGAAFDVQTVSQASPPASSGPAPTQTITDRYENLQTNGSTQKVMVVSESSAYSYDDTSADALGGGPYTYTQTQVTNYPISRPGLTMPLQTGVGDSLPLASVVTINGHYANSNGQAPQDGNHFPFNSVETTYSDGSSSYDAKWSDGSVSHDSIVGGNLHSTFSSPMNTFTMTVGLPQLINGVYKIPVNTVHTIPSATSTNYSAVDWYPGNGQPGAVQNGTIRQVIGPVASLPAECSGAMLRANAIEVDETSTSLVLSGTYSVASAQTFYVNNINVCSISNQTYSEYEITTGLMIYTSATKKVRWLTSMSG